MTFTTEFNLDEEVFVIENNRVVSTKIKQIQINTKYNTSDYNIKYLLNDKNFIKMEYGGTERWFSNKQVFKTKKELLKTL